MNIIILSVFIAIATIVVSFRYVTKKVKVIEKSEEHKIGGTL